MTAEDYAAKIAELENYTPLPSLRSLASIEDKVPHSTQVPEPEPDFLLLGENRPGYLSPTHEEEYLLATDTALADPSVYDPNDHSGRPIRLETSHPIPTDKDLHLKNPDSVYNWLRKHQPQVFLQDKDAGHHENLSERSSAKPTGTGRAGKRASHVGTSTPGPKTDHEMEDDTTATAEQGTGKKGRGKHGEDDGAYRPKGGSSRPAKRKREDGDGPAKGGRKKGRTSGAAAAAAAAS